MNNKTHETKPLICRISVAPMAFQGIFKGQLLYLSNNGFNIVIVCSDGPELKSVKESEGCLVLTIPFSRTISLTTDIVTVFKLFMVLRKIKPHIIHTHTSKAGLIGMISSYFIRKSIRIHSVPGLQLMESRGLKRLILSFSERLTYFIADVVCPNSNSLKEYILENKMCPSEKVRIIGSGSSNGVNLDKFSIHLKKTGIRNNIREKFGIMNDNIVLAYIGRIVREKGIHELIESFSNLSKKHKKLHLLMIGKFEDHYDCVDKEIKNIINDNPQIYVTGWVDDVENYLAASDIVVHPSYREGCSNALLQAGAMGLPSVTTNVAGCNDVIKNNETGLIVPLKDQVALEEALDILILDCRKRVEFGINAHNYIKANFASNIIWDKTAELYNEVLKDDFPSENVRKNYQNN